MIDSNAEGDHEDESEDDGFNMYEEEIDSDYDYEIDETEHW
eukprot:CAMPEP_0170774326 /NCGR_PEP_ID=MMETSP0733-20121128/9893_1 /TAXON_ID=186038 /ORGANISM="Fragilariopsis kerguelensis, Strain L26-C5" /LENGTH=40 /DNA_ID= /DNA_START= /DNA_END= /DNA_ORIENTATION=